MNCNWYKYTLNSDKRYRYNTDTNDELKKGDEMSRQCSYLKKQYTKKYYFTK